MSLRRRTALLSFVTIVLVAIGACVLARSFADEVERQGLLADRIEPAALVASALQAENARTAASAARFVVTGDADERALAEASRDESDRLIRTLRSLLMEEPALASAVNTTAQAHAAWMSDVIEPVLSEMQAGRAKAAAARLDAPAFQERFDELNTTTASTVRAIERARGSGLGDLRRITQDLGIALAMTGLLAIGLTVFTMLALRAWVLTPLDRVRADLREASILPSHETPIEPAGPTEIAELAGDAEALRRELLREIDAANAARSSLEHSAPIVVALQSAMAPTGADIAEGVDVFGTTRAAQGVIAGDWWDAIPLESGDVGLVIADVSGHDVDAGVTAVSLRSVVRSCLLAGLEPHRVMDIAARELRTHRRAVTAFVAIVQPEAGIFSWANAGHHPPLLLSGRQPVSSCAGTGPLLSPLGGSWRTMRMPFNAGDVCFAFTDGLVESVDSRGTELGELGLIALIDRLEPSIRRKPSELAERVISQARRRARSWNDDDITVLAFARTLGLQGLSPTDRD